jgi:hypothetical protein
MPSLADRLAALAALHAKGMLSDAEFARAKARVIAQWDPASGESGAGAPPPPPEGAPPKTLNPVVPGVGLALGSAAGGFGG